MGPASAEDHVLGIQEIILTFTNSYREAEVIVDGLPSHSACSVPIMVAIVFRKRTLCIFMSLILLYIPLGVTCFSVKQRFIKTASSAGQLGVLG